MTDSNPHSNDPPDPEPQPPTNFHHPYQPYTVQLDFMRTLYDVLEKGNNQVGILESPTGTVRPPFPPLKHSPLLTDTTPSYHQSHPTRLTH